ncbi:MAG: flagellar protein FlaG [Lachnospiraceae bacterium]|nr:flagellar protein FlaG [Lachnospiraceae bacterium]MDE6984072.1 flagellar protein FlaG [Lachnospiraceae bacterium]MDE7030516.1 flagellar protein FlaG [Lachnospiraceae bacterium]
MYMEPISRGKTRQQTVSTTQTAKTKKTPEQSAAPRAVEARKTESMDGAMDVQIAKESDESVTLSIQADKKQLIDDQKDVNPDKLKKVVEKAVASLPHYSDAKFGVHEKTNRIIIKLVDRDTQEVIKEFPPEKTLDLLAKRMELAGVLVDQRM